MCSEFLSLRLNLYIILWTKTGRVYLAVQFTKNNFHKKTLFRRIAN